LKQEIKYSLLKQLQQIKNRKSNNTDLYYERWAHICPKCGVRSGAHDSSFNRCSYAREDLFDDYDRDKTAALIALLRMHGYKIIK